MITPEGTISFPAIFEPKETLSGVLKYSCTLMVPKSDHKGVAKLKEAIEKASLRGKAKIWNGKIPKFKNTPLRDGDEEIAEGSKSLPEHASYVGMLFFTAYSNEAPGVVDRTAAPLMDQNKLYSGCIVRLDVNPYPYSQSGNNGVAWYLNNVMVVRDGKRLDGKQEATDAFAAYKEGGDDDLV